MTLATRLLLLTLLSGVAVGAQTGRSEAPKSRLETKATVHKMPRHAARQFSLRERQERAQLRSEQRREAKLAKKQRKQAMRRTRKMKKTAGVQNQ
jgi:hypothetical protein